MRFVRRLIGVYNAEASTAGELRYLIGKWRGTVHCGLCDVTHGWVREKHAFRLFLARLPVPFELVHLDQRSEAVTAASWGQSPVVLADTGAELEIVMDAASLSHCRGDVGEFERALRDALDRRGLTIGQ